VPARPEVREPPPAGSQRNASPGRISLPESRPLPAGSPPAIAQELDLRQGYSARTCLAAQFTQLAWATLPDAACRTTAKPQEPSPARCNDVVTGAMEGIMSDP
jgi:hypothetical protein